LGLFTPDFGRNGDERGGERENNWFLLKKFKKGEGKLMKKFFSLNLL
jgi:hypothetical protein